ncbi:unnamed protein product, partial [marine sediment metagenome]
RSLKSSGSIRSSIMESYAESLGEKRQFSKLKGTIEVNSTEEL